MFTWNNAVNRQKKSCHKLQVVLYCQWESNLAHAMHQAEPTILLTVTAVLPLELD